MTQPITYGAPNYDYSVDLESLQRKQKLADALRDQSMQQEPTQMVGGWAIPQGSLTGVAKLAQALSSKYQTDKNDQARKDLAGKMQTDLADVLRRGTEAQVGTPARNTTPATPVDDEGNAMPAPSTPAVPGSQSAASAIYMQHPATQQLGLSMAQQAAELARKRSQFEMMTGMGAGGAAAPAPGAAPGAPAPAGGAGAPPAGPAAMPPVAGSPQGNAPGFDANGVPTADLRRFAALDDPLGAYQKHVEELHKPKMSANGQVVQYQQLPTGGWGYAPGPGAVAAAQQFANVQTPKDAQAMAAQDAEYFDKTGRHLPAPGATSPTGPAQYLGPQPNGRFQGDPAAIQAQIAAIRDPNERAAAAQALRNQMTGANPNPQAAAAAGGEVAPATRLGPQPTGMAPAAQRDIDKRMGEKLNDLTAEEIVTGYKTSNKAADQLSSILESRKAVAAGAFQGAGAGAKTDISKFAKGVFGIDLDPTKTTNAEYLRSTLGSQVLNQAKALGANPSNTDAKRIEEIVGNIDKDPGALDKVLEWQEQMVRKSVAQHNSNVDQMEKRGYKPPIDYRVQLPEQQNYAPQRRAADKTPVVDFNSLPKRQ